jgi:2,3-bisphosphoglycerate-independent phosphoglycerate mutase
MTSSGPLPIVLVLLDGLGGPAAAAAARTPRLDALVTRGASGVLAAPVDAVEDDGGRSRFAIVGYRPGELPGRAVLEARGHRLAVDAGAVYALAALRPSVVRDGQRWCIGRAEARHAASAARSFHLLDRLDPDVRVLPIDIGRAIVAFEGLPSDRLADGGPGGDGPLVPVRPLQRGPLASAAARRVEEWRAAAALVLQRRRLSALSLRWFGRPRRVQPFADRYGVRGPVVAAAPALLGLAETVGLDAVEDRPGPDAAADLRRRLDVAARAVNEGAGVAVCHSDAVLAAAATGDAGAVREAVRRVDRALGRLDRPPFDRAVVCAAAGPVLDVAGVPAPPLVVRVPGLPPDEITRFGPGAARHGRLGAVDAPALLALLTAFARDERAAAVDAIG